MRRHLSSACFSIGTLWAAAGVMKMVFGAHVTVPFLPPFGLEHVAILPAMITGLVWFGIGAVAGRGAPREDESALPSHVPAPALPGEHGTSPIFAQQTRRADPVSVKRE